MTICSFVVELLLAHFRKVYNIRIMLFDIPSNFQRLPGEANKLLTESLSLTFLSFVLESMKPYFLKQSHIEHM